MPELHVYASYLHDIYIYIPVLYHSTRGSSDSCGNSNEDDNEHHIDDGNGTIIMEAKR